MTATEQRLEEIRKFRMSNTGCVNCPVSDECRDGEYADATSCEELLDTIETQIVRNQRSMP